MSRRSPRAPEVVQFKAPDPDQPGVDTLDLAQLRQRGSPSHLAALQRLEFMLLMLYTHGRGEHLIDFVPYRIEPDTLVVIRPGTVHRFALNDSMQARLLVIDPVFILPERLAWIKPLIARDPWPVRSTLTPAMRDEFLTICNQIDADVQRQTTPELRAALVRQRLYALLLLLRIEWNRDDGIDVPAPAPAAQLVADFRVLLEQHYIERWTVQRYAQKLGCAERTLTRACLATSDQTAKALVDERVLLEARRLLAHGGDSIEAVALRLGFGGAGALVQFFRRLDGHTPASFRQAFRQAETAP
ncbi:helix-turn-helix domain-containing protein [Piscinibacter sakaiensis]|uniref:helix-turn-helix domain-containing protein n=1 Tax=Piscinibacter sakaiensis TaxID=1547922 RepID=UPI003AB0A0E5